MSDGRKTPRERVRLRQVTLSKPLRSRTDRGVVTRTGGIVAMLDEYVEAPTAPSPGGADLTFPPNVPQPVTLSNAGGPIGAGSQVQLIFWGDAWIQPITTPSAGQLLLDVESILSGPWRAGLRQYGIGRIPLGGAIIVPQPPPAVAYNNISTLQGDIESLVSTLIDEGELPQGTIDLFLVFLPSGTSGPPGSPKISGAHWAYGETWVGFVLNGSEPAMTIRFTHELAEMCTDPDGGAWQVNPRNSGPGGSFLEIGDICQKRTSTLAGVSVQAYWSVKDNACLIPTAPSVRKTLLLAGITLGGGGLRTIENPIPSLNSLIDQLFGGTLP